GGCGTWPVGAPARAPVPTARRNGARFALPPAAYALRPLADREYRSLGNGHRQRGGLRRLRAFLAPVQRRLWALALDAAATTPARRQRRRGPRPGFRVTAGRVARSPHL